tara:strand:+ start:20 stop:148 length:129 start_codon:yes stop_codon:yes gene_type:complete
LKKLILRGVAYSKMQLLFFVVVKEVNGYEVPAQYYFLTLSPP